MRFEAAGQILRMAFLGVAAASTLTTALVDLGMGGLAKYMLALGVCSSFLFAYGYTEWGIFNRKNREKAEYGNNFARPDMRIDDALTGAAVFAAVHGREPDKEELEAIEQAVEERYTAHRNGVDIE